MGAPKIADWLENSLGWHSFKWRRDKELPVPGFRNPRTEVGQLTESSFELTRGVLSDWKNSVLDGVQPLKINSIDRNHGEKAATAFVQRCARRQDDGLYEVIEDFPTNFAAIVEIFLQKILDKHNKRHCLEALLLLENEINNRFLSRPPRKKRVYRRRDELEDPRAYSDDPVNRIGYTASITLTEELSRDLEMVAWHLHQLNRQDLLMRYILAGLEADGIDVSRHVHLIKHGRRPRNWQELEELFKEQGGSILPPEAPHEPSGP